MTAAVLETSRLRLRRFGADDLDDLAALVADEEQMRFYPRPRTRAEAAAWLARNLDLYATHGFGFWLVAPRRSDEFLGYCGIRPLVVGGIELTEIGWHTRKAVWGRGIATEAAAAVRDLAFTGFAVSRLVALIRPGHQASRRVAEKIGMREEGVAELHGDRYVTYVGDAP